MSEYQRRRAETYKRFSGAILMYQATANSFTIKPYLKYFMVDNALVPALRKLFEKQKNKKLQLCDEGELSLTAIHAFIDSIKTADLIRSYQLEHGPEGSLEFEQAREHFETLARTKFDIELAAAAKNVTSAIGKHIKCIPTPPSEKLDASKSLRHANYWPEVVVPQRSLPPLPSFQDWARNRESAQTRAPQPMLFELLQWKSPTKQQHLEFEQLPSKHEEVCTPENYNINEGIDLKQAELDESIPRHEYISPQIVSCQSETPIEIVHEDNTIVSSSASNETSFGQNQPVIIHQEIKISGEFEESCPQLCDSGDLIVAPLMPLKITPNIPQCGNNSTHSLMDNTKNSFTCVPLRRLRCFILNLERLTSGIVPMIRQYKYRRRRIKGN